MPKSSSMTGEMSGGLAALVGGRVAAVGVAGTGAMVEAASVLWMRVAVRAARSMRAAAAMKARW
jgi:hypothetical protein